MLHWDDNAQVSPTSAVLIDLDPLHWVALVPDAPQAASSRGTSDRDAEEGDAATGESRPARTAHADEPVAAWWKKMLLGCCLPGAALVLAAALLTRDQLHQSQLPTRRRSRRRYPDGWKKGLLAATATFGLLLLAAPLLQGWLVRGLFVLAVLLLLSLWDPFKAVADSGRTRRLKQAAAALALLCLLPGIGLPAIKALSPRGVLGVVRGPDTDDGDSSGGQGENTAAPLAPDSIAEFEPEEKALVEQFAHGHRAPSEDAEVAGKPQAGPRRVAGLSPRDQEVLGQGGGSRPFGSAGRLSLNPATPRDAGGRRGGVRSGNSAVRRESDRPASEDQLRLWDDSPTAVRTTHSLLVSASEQPLADVPEPSQSIDGFPLPVSEVLGGADTDPMSWLVTAPSSSVVPEGTPAGESISGPNRFLDPTPNDGGALGTPSTADFAVQIVPEPGSLVLLGVGVSGVVGYYLSRGANKGRVGSPRCKRR